MTEENDQTNDPWRDAGTFATHIAAMERKKRAIGRGLEAKIRRQANGIFHVRVRGEESAEIVGKMRKPFRPMGSHDG